MNAKELLAIASLKPEDLMGYSGTSLATIYRDLREKNPPLRLLNAFAGWYQQHCPLTPPERDALFTRVLEELWPKPPIGPGGGKRVSRTTSRNPGRVSTAAPKPTAENSKGGAAARVSEPSPAPAVPMLEPVAPIAPVAPSSKALACEIWKSLPRDRATVRTFVDACLAQAWTFSWTGKYESRRARLMRELRSVTRKALRRKRRQASTVRRDRAIWDILYPPYVDERSKPVDKDRSRSHGSMKTLMTYLLQVEPLQEALCDHEDVGCIPSVDQVLRIFRARGVTYNPTAEVRRHQQTLLTPRAAYAGQVAYLDATTSKIKVASNLSFGRRSENGYHYRFLYVDRDLGSGHLRIAEYGAESEGYGWGGGLPSWGPVPTGNAMAEFMLARGSAPEFVVFDESSDLPGMLRHIEPGKPPNLQPGLVFWLACGVIPYVRQGKRPTGGAVVERDIRTALDHLMGINARQMKTRELSGAGWNNKKLFQSEAEYQAALNELRATMNNLVAPHSTHTRQELWELHADQRAARGLAPDAAQTWPGIVARAVVASVEGKRVKVRDAAGKRAEADLTGPVTGVSGAVENFNAEGLPAICIPTGLLASDTPGSWRIFILSPMESRNVPEVLMGTADLAAADELGQDLRRPMFGRFKAQPEGTEDDIARERDAAKAEWKRRATGTEDARPTIEDSPFKSESQ